MKVAINIQIKQAFIYGFGRWIDKEIRFSDHSLSIIYGENEAGKSSLQQFILFMLFGFPPKKRQFYRPKTGSKMGGRLTLVNSNLEEFTIERMDNVNNGAAACYTENGDVMDEAWLSEQLSGVSSSIYESIYSFSALDLNHLRNMKNEDFGEILFNIGLTGATNVNSIEKKLDNKINELFKRTGKVPLMNVQIEELERIFQDWKQFHQEESAYREKNKAIIRLSEEMERVQQKIIQVKEELAANEKIKHALPTIYRYYQLKDRIMQYPQKIYFPENGRKRLQELKDPLLSLKSEQAIIEGQEKEYKHKQEKLKQELASAAAYNTANNLLQSYRFVQQWEQEMKQLQTDIHKLNAQLETEMAQLQIPIDIEQLKQLHFPFYTEKRWLDLKHRLDQLQMEREQLQQEANEWNTALNQINQDLDKHRKLLLPKEELHLLQSKKGQVAESEAMQKMVKHSEMEAIEWHEEKVKKKKQAQQLCYGSIVVAFLFGFVHLFITSIPSPVMTIVIILIIGVGQLMLRNNTIKNMDMLLHQMRIPQENNAIPASEMKEIERVLAEQVEIENTVSTLQAESKKIKMELLKHEEKKNSYEQRKKRFTSDLETQYEAYPFLQSIDIAYWAEAYYMIKRMLHCLQEIEEKNSQYKQIEEKEAAYIREVSQFLDTQGIHSANKDVYVLADTVERFVEQYTDKIKSIDQYEQFIKECRAKKKMIEQKIGTYEQEIYALFNQANVQSEEAYFIAADQGDEKKETERAYRQCYEELIVRFPADMIEAWQVDQFDENELEKQGIKQKKHIKDLEEELETIRQQIADLQAEVGKLERSQAYSEATYRLEMGREKLNRLAKEWSVYKTAKEVLSETKRAYRKKYFRTVLAKTTAYFSEITDHVYHRVIEPKGKKGFRVEAHNGITYQVNELSQGTVDQLYISLRIAIGEIMSGKHNVPFIMDDAFIHFDSHRTKAIMKVMKEVSKAQQIIIFTCKKEIVTLADEAHIIELERPIMNHTGT
ncbi:AAA family ATPase [Virgibacillus sp. W0181]|uniref:ATP-binding protein n=1 Tax=Virgibacillus sp. W0181 TaxID=3391581 RepID=UPI003F477CD3